MSSEVLSGNAPADPVVPPVASAALVEGAAGVADAAVPDWLVLEEPAGAAPAEGGSCNGIVKSMSIAELWDCECDCCDVCGRSPGAGPGTVGTSAGESVKSRVEVPLGASAAAEADGREKGSSSCAAVAVLAEVAGSPTGAGTTAAGAAAVVAGGRPFARRASLSRTAIARSYGGKVRQ